MREDRIEALPAKKPAKALPCRQVFMLVMVKEGKVLLEKRPASGIWGGLLSLPELADDFSEAALLQCKARILPLGRVARYVVQPAFLHVFTHFKLRVVPVFIQLAGADEKVAAPYVWCDLDGVESAPLPSPVKKLLLAFREGCGDGQARFQFD